MRAVVASRIDRIDPLAALQITERPDPVVDDGWALVEVHAASLNHHDLWKLKGVGLPPGRTFPLILGCDAAGVDETGREVVVHAVLGSQEAGGGDETLDPNRSILSGLRDGTFADRVAVPRRNLIAKPPNLSMVEASCLPTAYLTAYRMLFTRAQAQAGQTLLIQGAGGGVSTAAALLAKAAGLRVWVTTRNPEKAEQAHALGVDAAFISGERLPDRVDIVLDNVGDATWAHSIRSLRPGGTLVTCGATSGPRPPAEIDHIFAKQLSILGSTMGTLAEFESLIEFCKLEVIHPLVNATHDLDDAYEAFRGLAASQSFGKIVLTAAT